MRKILLLIFFSLVFNTQAWASGKFVDYISFENKHQDSLIEVFNEEYYSFIDKRLASVNSDENGKMFVDAPKQDVEKEFFSSELRDYSTDVNKKPFQLTIVDSAKNMAKSVYELQIEQTEKPVPLLKDYLTFRPQKGPLEKIQVWSAYQMNFSETIPEQGDSDSKFNVGVINILVDGTFNGGKENFRIMLDPTHRSNHPNFMQPFFQDLYIETSRIPHTKILVGNSRPGVGIEGAQSPYTLDYINRSQIARNLANIRKFGVRVRGDYSLFDYDTGVYSSSTNFTDFFPGHEFDGWVNFKPLGKTNGKYGKLVTGSGIQSGEKHGMSYYLTGAYIGYDYKKFKTKFEYARANGSNGGSGLTNKHSQGLFWTSSYQLTPKLEILARYDQFDSDRNLKNNNQREYTLGTNYYLKGQALKFIFNYIYCQRDNSIDSHRLMLGTQIIL